jgi:hypothetical protein
VAQNWRHGRPTAGNARQPGRWKLVSAHGRTHVPMPVPAGAISRAKMPNASLFSCSTANHNTHSCGWYSKFIW